MRLSNEAVTSCKAMAMVMLCGAVQLFLLLPLPAVAICFNCPALLRKRGLLGGVHCYSYALKYMVDRITMLNRIQI